MWISIYGMLVRRLKIIPQTVIFTRYYTKYNINYIILYNYYIIIIIIKYINIIDIINYYTKYKKQHHTKTHSCYLKTRLLHFSMQCYF